jgi:hypothetical protein
MNVFGELSAKELLLNSAILALVFRFVWGAFSEVLNRIRQLIARRVREYEIDLGQYHQESDGGIDFYCLLIRYGTDSYLKGLASEQDKFDGRLQNKILPIEVKKTGQGNARFVLHLPVHQRIGTQFKCFAEVRNVADLEKVSKALEECERIHGVSMSSSQFKNRVYFLLKDFGTSQSVDGIANNICYPV